MSIDLSTLSPEDRAKLAVLALHDPSMKDPIKSASKEVRKTTQQLEAEAKRAAKLDPTSPTYDPKFAARVKTMELNKKLRAEGGLPPKGSSASKEELSKLLAETKCVLPIGQVRQAKIIPLHDDAGAIRGYRGVVKIKRAGADEEIFRNEWTKVKTPTLDLDQMKAAADTYVRSKLSSFTA